MTNEELVTFLRTLAEPTVNDIYVVPEERDRKFTMPEDVRYTKPRYVVYVKTDGGRLYAYDALGRLGILMGRLAALEAENRSLRNTLAQVHTMTLGIKKPLAPDAG